MLGQKQEAPPTADPSPPPPPVPVTSATTPPVWRPPDTTPPLVGSGSSAPAPVSPELAKARAAEEAKDWKKLKSLLDKRVRAGKASTEEAQMLFDACTALKDKSCVEAVRAKYLDVSPASSQQ